jgi:hypothetical protein
VGRRPAAVGRAGLVGGNEVAELRVEDEGVVGVGAITLYHLTCHVNTMHESNKLQCYLCNNEKAFSRDLLVHDTGT